MGVGPLSDLFCYYLHKYNRLDQAQPQLTKYLSLIPASYLNRRFNQLQGP